MSEKTTQAGTVSAPDFKAIDPKGLFKDIYDMEGITAGECRSVFLDWAISSRPAAEEKPALVALFAYYGPKFPDHPMTGVLQQAVAAPVGKPRRRGGVRTGRRDQGQD